MQSNEIIAQINSIYEKFFIPPHLQLHMRRVTAVAQQIIDNWTGPPINTTDIIATCLIHDLGNIMKIRFDKNPIAHLPKGLDWPKIKQDLQDKYGTNDEEVTLNMARELNVPGRIMHLLIHKEFAHTEEQALGTDWDLKICAYADGRVNPWGIVSLWDRYQELRERNKNNPKDPVNHPRTKEFIQLVFQMEQDIFSNTTISKEDITNESIGIQKSPKVL